MFGGGKGEVAEDEPHDNEDDVDERTSGNGHSRRRQAPAQSTWSKAR